MLCGYIITIIIVVIIFTNLTSWELMEVVLPFKCPLRALLSCPSSPAIKTLLMHNNFQIESIVL